MFSRTLSRRFSLITGAREFLQIFLLLLIGVGFLFETSQQAFALNPEAYCYTDPLTWPVPYPNVPLAQCTALSALGLYDGIGTPCGSGGISCSGSAATGGFVTSISTGDYGAGLTGVFGASGLSTVTYIRVSSNQLTGFDPTGFPNLTSLDVSGNLLSSFDNGSGFPSLITLNISNNPNLSSIAFTNGILVNFNAAYGMTSLTSLDLHGNNLNTFVT